MLNKKFKITYIDNRSNGKVEETTYISTSTTTKEEVIEFFELKKEDVTYFKVEEIHTCPSCGKEFTGYGNNPAPLIYNEPVCDECNFCKVIPARIKLFKH